MVSEMLLFFTTVNPLEGGRLIEDLPYVSKKITIIYINNIQLLKKINIYIYIPYYRA